MWLREHTPATLACAYVAVGGAVAIAWLRATAPPTLAHGKLVDASAIYAWGALLFPFVWSVVAGHAMVPQLPVLAFIGLLYPPLLLLADVASVQHLHGLDPKSLDVGVQVDANTLSSLSLALSGVLVKAVSDGFATSAAPLLMATLLVALLVVMPSPALHAHSRHAAAFRAVQKVALQWCIGFTLTAVATAFFVSLRKAAPRQGEELRKAMTEDDAASSPPHPAHPPPHHPAPHYGRSLADGGALARYGAAGWTTLLA